MPTVGVISDTHGLLRPEALHALEGSDVILHAGDVGEAAILDRLGEVAPVHAVFGNTDHGELRSRLPHHDVVDLGGPLAYLVHIAEDIDLDPEAAGMALVVTGHTHRPRIRRAASVLHLNPGSAGPRRFELPVSVACVDVSEDGGIDARIIELKV